MNIKSVADFLNPRAIDEALAEARRADKAAIRDAIQKARSLSRLSLFEVAVLMRTDGELLEELYETARFVKNEVYGARLVLFAPLYISNLCDNECVYCDFRKGNKEVRRRWLTQNEIAEQTRNLIRQGFTRALLIAGDGYPKNDFRYLVESIGTIYGTKLGKGEIRRVHVNIAPASVEQFYELREARVGVYQCLQESYHRATYASVHKAGKKMDFEWRATVMHRAMASGIRDVGMGVLYGLYDWRWETLALFQHVRDLERTYGAGARMLSVPRLQQASAPAAHSVGDDDLLKIIAVLRLAVPYAGLAISTRESAEIRRRSLEVGISQMSAGASSGPIGESDHLENEAQPADERPLREIVKEVSELGFLPSFCTACFRVGRTGADFKNLASHPHVISRNCESNALATLLEYLCDYSAGDARSAGEHLIDVQLQKMPPTQRAFVTQMLERIRRGERDVFV